MASEHDGFTYEIPSQRDELLLTANIYLAAIDLAEKLESSGDKQDVIYEAAYYRETIPEHAIPQCWRDIQQPIRTLTVTFEGLPDDDRYNLHVRAKFDEGWESVLSKPAHSSTNAPLEGITRQLSSAFGPLNTSDGTKPYDAHASYAEITTLLSAITHVQQYQAAELPITDPLDARQAKMIIDTADETEAVDVVTTHRFEIMTPDDTFIVDVEQSDSRIRQVDVRHVLQNEIVIKDGDFYSQYDSLLAQVKLGTHEQGISFYTESEEAGVLPEDAIDETVEHDMKSNLLESLNAITDTVAAPDLPVLEADQMDVAADTLRAQERYGLSAPTVDLTEDGYIDPTDIGMDDVSDDEADTDSESDQDGFDPTDPST